MTCILVCIHLYMLSFAPQTVENQCHIIDDEIDYE